MISVVGEWRSLVARLLWEQDVGSSNLSTPTNFLDGIFCQAFMVTVAQLVEPRTVTPVVVGSSPIYPVGFLFPHKKQVASIFLLNTNYATPNHRFLPP